MKSLVKGICLAVISELFKINLTEPGTPRLHDLAARGAMSPLRARLWSAFVTSVVVAVACHAGLCH